jgi:hypothetical protein
MVFPDTARDSDVRFKFSNSTAVVALGMAFVITPAVVDVTSPFGIDSAYAKNGGNGNSGGNGNGNSGGNGSGRGSDNGKTSEKSNSSKSVEAGKTSNTNTASKLGALNAARASAKAFAKAVPNSRVGKIKAYYVANQAALTAQTSADETDAVALHESLMSSGPISAVNAYKALQADPKNPNLQDAYNQAATDVTLTGEQIAAVETAYSDWQSAVNADAIAADAASKAQAALDAAANNKPVSAEARAAVNALLAGKIN